MVEPVANKALSTTLLIFFAVALLVSLIGIPLFLFIGVIVDIDGPSILGPIFLGLAITSGVVAVGGPLAGLWLNRKSVKSSFLWLCAVVTAAPGIVAGILFALLLS